VTDRGRTVTYIADHRCREHETEREEKEEDEEKEKTGADPATLPRSACWVRTDDIVSNVM
jgi:hypothetical protein